MSASLVSDSIKPVEIHRPDVEKTPAGTSVGVENPYAHVDRCDHCTDEGRCRFAVEHGDRDPEFADRLARRGFRCPVVSGATRELGSLDEEGLTGPWDWADCPRFRSTDHDRECARCGLAERRVAHDDDRPLLEEHHLSYAESAARGAAETRAGNERDPRAPDSPRGDGDPGHEITVSLCRWCHAKVHDSWARVDDDANPDPEAIAEREGRRVREQSELAFSSAAERFDRDGSDCDGSDPDGPDGGVK